MCPPYCHPRPSERRSRRPAGPATAPSAAGPADAHHRATLRARRATLSLSSAAHGAHAVLTLQEPTAIGRRRAALSRPVAADGAAQPVGAFLGAALIGGLASRAGGDARVLPAHAVGADLRAALRRVRAQLTVRRAARAGGALAVRAGIRAAVAVAGAGHVVGGAVATAADAAGAHQRAALGGGRARSPVGRARGPSAGAAAGRRARAARTSTAARRAAARRGGAPAGAAHRAAVLERIVVLAVAATGAERKHCSEERRHEGERDTPGGGSGHHRGLECPEASSGEAGSGAIGDDARLARPARAPRHHWLGRQSICMFHEVSVGATWPLLVGTR